MQVLLRNVLAAVVINFVKSVLKLHFVSSFVRTKYAKAVKC